MKKYILTILGGLVVFAAILWSQSTITSPGSRREVTYTPSTLIGITASTTQTQGQGPLTAIISEISVVANLDDTVTLTTASAGLLRTIINNGANTLQIFPASGDNLSAGLNTSTQLEANEVITFVALDTTNWHIVSETEILHAEMHDEDNTDVFVVNDSGADFHAYHTNGLVSGDLAGWTFDAGGAGTSFPIASIADSVGASGSRILVTTTGSHLLAVGDIISQTNLANAAYVGVFVVVLADTATTYEVAAVFTATGTGTMDQAATLQCLVGSSGVYAVYWWASATNATNNETFDFELCLEGVIVTGTKVRRKFGTAADFGSFSGGGVVSVADLEQISFALSNEDTAGDLTIRNFTVVLIRL